MVRQLHAHLRDQWMGALALFLVVAGGGAYAAFDPVGSDGDIDACFEKRSGDLDLLKGKKCGKKEKPITWSQIGPKGDPGQQGASGSARAYGRISGQGVVDTARSTPGVSVVRQVEGIYCVTVPGLTPANAVMVTSMHFGDPDSLGGDTAASNVANSCDGFQVTTWDNTSNNVENDAGFNFMIP